MRVARRLSRHPALPLAAIVLAVAVAGPYVLSPGALDTATLIALYTMAAAGLTLLMGYAGQVSLGHGAFFAVGAYVVGVLTVRAGVPALAALVAAPVAATLLAYLVGLPILRLRGHHLAVATLALAIIVNGLASNLEGVTGGAIGLSGIPTLGAGGWTATPADLFQVACLAALASLLFARNVIHSRPGRALRALGSEEAASESLGVPVGRYRLHVFAVSGAMAGGAGALYALYLQFLSPDAFTVQLSVFLVLVVAVGGLRNPYGALVGALVVELLTLGLTELGTGEDLPARLPVALNTLVYGLVILLIMRLLPAGLLPSLEALARAGWARARGGAGAGASRPDTTEESAWSAPGSTPEPRSTSSSTATPSRTSPPA
jgi:branched-chain amino acid transport system permease protein